MNGQQPEISDDADAAAFEQFSRDLEELVNWLDRSSTPLPQTQKEAAD